jgi:RNA polymerase sigma-70 factor (ECF subfamily)
MKRALSLRVSVAQVHTGDLDQVAFEELYATYLPRVFNYVFYRLGDNSAAEDVTAEVFERALTRLHTYRADQGAFSTWLYRIAHNMVANHLRARRRRPEPYSLESLPTVAVGGPTLEQAAINAEQMRRLLRCMRMLPERQQEVLALKFASGMSNQGIARTMRLKPGHVGVLLHRAVSALRLALEREEMER